MTSDNLHLYFILGVILFVAFALVLVAFFFKSQRALLQRELRNQQLAIAHREELIRASFAVQEEERQRIAADLHDEVGSKLSVLNLNLHRLAKVAGVDTSVVDDMRTLVTNTLATTRRISHDLMPPTLQQFGLSVALQELCDAIMGIEVQLDIEHDHSEERDSTTELQLYRVVQELIQNTLKHAEAERIHILLNRNPGELRLIYTDDGRGFDTSDERNLGGLGMKNLQNRLQAIQARYQFVSSPGEGMTLRVVHRP